MQPPNSFFDEMSKLMTNAMGVAQGARTEAETAMKSWMDRWLAERNFVTREEFDALRAIALKANEENASLLARIEALEGRAGGQSPAAAKPAAKKATRPVGAAPAPASGDGEEDDGTVPVSPV